MLELNETMLETISGGTSWSWTKNVYVTNKNTATVTVKNFLAFGSSINILVAQSIS